MTSDEKVFKYMFPLQLDGGVERPAYDPSVEGELYLYHYGANYLTVIQDKGVGYFHRDEVNVKHEKLDKSAVEESDNVLKDFT